MNSFSSAWKGKSPDSRLFRVSSRYSLIRGETRPSQSGRARSRENPRHWSCPTWRPVLSVLPTSSTLPTGGISIPLPTVRTAAHGSRSSPPFRMIVRTHRCARLRCVPTAGVNTKIRWIADSTRNPSPVRPAVPGSRSGIAQEARSPTTMKPCLEPHGSSGRAPWSHSKVSAAFNCLWTPGTRTGSAGCGNGSSGRRSHSHLWPPTSPQCENGASSPRWRRVSSDHRKRRLSSSGRKRRSCQRCLRRTMIVARRKGSHRETPRSASCSPPRPCITYYCTNSVF